MLIQSLKFFVTAKLIYNTINNNYVSPQLHEPCSSKQHLIFFFIMPLYSSHQSIHTNSSVNSIALPICSLFIQWHLWLLFFPIYISLLHSRKIPKRLHFQWNFLIARMFCIWNSQQTSVKQCSDILSIHSNIRL